MKTKTKKKTPKRRKKGRVLPDDACPTCGTMMVHKVGPRSTSVHGERIAVPSVPHLKCPKCGEGMIDLKDAIRQTEQAFELYRRKYGLLSAEEVRAIREQYRLSELEFALLLRVRERDIHRWESGRSIHSAAMDLVLRVVRDVPGGIDFLRKRAA